MKTFFTEHLWTTASINSGLRMISEWSFQRKMNFNPDPTKKAEGLVFLLSFQTKQKTKHPSWMPRR